MANVIIRENVNIESMNFVHPAHVGIIMDGNGRWAVENNLARTEGHSKGARVCTEIIHAAIDAGIEHLTLYAFSTENWTRPGEEIRKIMKILKEYLKHEIFVFLRRGVKFKVIGEKEKLSGPIRFLIKNAESLSENNTGMNLYLALSYGGKNEIVRAVKKMAQTGYDFNHLTEPDLEKNLDAGDIPPADLIIRTSGEQRLSNFLTWQSAYAELYFTNTPWPEFQKKDFLEALKSYGRRQRKFGSLERSALEK